jgi:hypothetical protein
VRQGLEALEPFGTIHRTSPLGEPAGKLLAAALGHGDGVDADDAHGSHLLPRTLAPSLESPPRHVSVKDGVRGSARRPVSKKTTHEAAGMLRRFIEAVESGALMAVTPHDGRER